jgi:uncharacterized membrane protein YfcA
VKERVFRAEGTFAPNHKIGLPCGVGAGITSTFAHGAGPIVSMFLIPQRLPKVIYVGTTVLVFTWINWIKLPFYCLGRDALGWNWLPPAALINRQTLLTSALFLPVVPLGVWLGVWMNRRIPERWFIPVIYTLVLATGVELIGNFDLAGWFRR